MSRTNIAFSSEDDAYQGRELLLQSLRHKLREKRGQFLKNEPEVSLLALRLENDLLAEMDIATLLHQRIWPNEEEYNWLSGLLIYTPRSGFLLPNERDRMGLYANPKSYRPVTASISALFP